MYKLIAIHLRYRYGRRSNLSFFSHNALKRFGKNDKTSISVECHNFWIFSGRVSFQRQCFNKSQIETKAQHRVKALRSLHEGIGICLRSLSKNVFCKHACQTKSATYVVFHFALKSYVDNVPETDDLLKNKRRGSPKYPYRKCIATNGKVLWSFWFRKRYVRKTLQLIKSASQKASAAKESEQFFAGESMLPLLP